MPSTDRVPQADSEFDDYINETFDYLNTTPAGAQPNWERLGLTNAEKNQWGTYRTDWNNAYAKVKTNKAQNIRNSNDTEAKNQVKEDFTEWVLDPAMNKLNRIAASPNITNTDRSTFNIKLRDDVPTARPQITTAPFVDMKAEDGGVVLITCRVESDANRASMQPDADVVEMRYCIVNAQAQPPNGAQDCPSTELSSKSMFRFTPPSGNAGKRLYAYLRWRNNAQPEKSGPWCQVMTIIIGD